MDDRPGTPAIGEVAVDPYRTLRWMGLVFAILFPTLITWGYFVLAGSYSKGTQQTVYLIAKVIQFGFPAAWTWFALREPLRTSRPTWSGVLMGIAFGLAVTIAGMAVYHFALRQLPVFASASELVQQKVKAFGVDSASKYFALAGFYSLFHSLLEEYYFRWFVFRQSWRLMPLWAAILLSGVAFTLHHIVVLSVYFKGEVWLIMLLAGATAIGGFFWAWLFHRSDSIFDTWPSHLLIDVGVFFGVGYELVRHAF